MSSNKHLGVKLNALLLFFLSLVLLKSSVTAQKVAGSIEKQIEITLKAEKETIMLNEPTLLFFEIKNNSSENLCFGAGGDYRNWLGRPNRFLVTLTRDNGKPVPQIEALDHGGFLYCERVPASEKFTIKLHLSDWAKFQEPGLYTINIKRNLVFLKDKSNTETFPKSDFFIEANLNIKIKVIPTDKNKMGEVIDSLGKAMLDENNSNSYLSSHALLSINDERTIKYFSEALLKYSNEDILSSNGIADIAAWALSKYNVDEAINGLKAVMNNSNERLRSDVATAFYCSNHPQAFDLLLSMKTDSYDLVRLRVAQGLSRTKSEKNFNLLDEMLKKENEDIKQSAYRSITCHYQ